jgi:aryl-alcohol dehydrogenase-like predicted oxidoreductase
LWCARHRNLVSLTSEQLRDSLLDHDFERDVFNVADCHELGVIAYSAPAEPLWTEKCRSDQSFQSGSRFATAAKSGDYGKRITSAVIRTIETIGNIARESQITSANLRIARVLRRQDVSAVLAGPFTSNQIIDLLAAVDFGLMPQVAVSLDHSSESHCDLAA